MKKTKKPRMSSVDRSLGVGEITPTTNISNYNIASYDKDMSAKTLTGSYKPTRRKKKKK